jgi:hypothetical protein
MIDIFIFSKCLLITKLVKINDLFYENNIIYSMVAKYNYIIYYLSKHIKVKISYRINDEFLNKRNYFFAYLSPKCLHSCI